MSENLTFIQMIPGKHNSVELQKTAVIGTPTIIRKVLNVFIRKVL